VKLTYKGDYSLKAILDLAMHHGGDPVTINDMAKRIDAPVKFLEQILLDLKGRVYRIAKRQGGGVSLI